MIDTTDLRALASGATPGPWNAQSAGDGYVFGDEFVPGTTIYDAGLDSWTVAIALGDSTLLPHAANASFIAAFNPQTALALADEIDRLRAALEPFARAHRAIGAERGPFRFETITGYRELYREDFERAAAALAPHTQPAEPTS